MQAEIPEVVDNHPDIQRDNPGFKGSDESLPSNSQSYASLADRSGTSMTTEQEIECAYDQSRAHASTCQENYCVHRPKLTHRVLVMRRDPLLFWPMLNPPSMQLIPLMQKHLMTNHRRALPSQFHNYRSNHKSFRFMRILTQCLCNHDTGGRPDSIK